MEVEEDTGSQKAEKVNAELQIPGSAMTADQNERLEHAMETRRTNISCPKEGCQVMGRLVWNGKSSTGQVAKCMACAKTIGTKKLYEHIITKLGVEDLRASQQDGSKGHTIQRYPCRSKQAAPGTNHPPSKPLRTSSNNQDS